MAAKKTQTFSAAEKAAMKERAAELKAEARAGKDRAEGEHAVCAAIAAMPPADRALGERVHALVTVHAPALLPRLWYGMPAYANAAGKVVCFFQAASKFKTRYATLGFTDASRLDEGAGPMWPTGHGLTSISPAEEKAIATLIRKAVST